MLAILLTSFCAVIFINFSTNRNNKVFADESMDDLFYFEATKYNVPGYFDNDRIERWKELLNQYDEIRIMDKDALISSIGVSDFAGKIIYLMCDINFNNENILSSVDATYSNSIYQTFAGTFDGMGHTIRNINFKTNINTAFFIQT